MSASVARVSLQSADAGSRGGPTLLGFGALLPPVVGALHPALCRRSLVPRVRPRAHVSPAHVLVVHVLTCTVNDRYSEPNFDERFTLPQTCEGI